MHACLLYARLRTILKIAVEQNEKRIQRVEIANPKYSDVITQSHNVKDTKIHESRLVQF